MPEEVVEKKGPEMGKITKSVTVDDAGFQKVPRMPGAPREADDFNPDGSAKNADVVAVQEEERKALNGEVKAPAWAPETERENTKAALAEKSDVPINSPADVKILEPDTTSPVPTMTPVADASNVSAPADKK